MPLSLDERELVLLRNAIATLASPLEAQDVDTWRSEVNAAVRDLFRGDRAVFVLAGSEAGAFQSNEYDEGALQSYFAYYRDIDEGMRRVRTDGLDVFCRRQLFRDDPRTLLESECFNDFLLPNGIGDSVGMVADGAPGRLTGVWIHNRRFGDTNAGERGLEIARLLLPALRAGVAVRRRLGRSRTRLAMLLDTIEEGLALVGPGGEILHLNASLRALFAGCPVRSRVEARIAAAARAAARLRRPGHEDEVACLEQRLTAAGRTWQIHAARIGLPLDLPPDAAMVAVRASRSPPDAGSLRARFGLTKRQAEVAILLWKGRTNRQIAEELFISPHTARHHTEAVLAKLDIHSREDVREAVAEGAG